MLAVPITLATATAPLAAAALEHATGSYTTVLLAVSAATPSLPPPSTSAPRRPARPATDEPTKHTPLRCPGGSRPYRRELAGRPSHPRRAQTRAGPAGRPAPSRSNAAPGTRCSPSACSPPPAMPAPRSPSSCYPATAHRTTPDQRRSQHRPVTGPPQHRAGQPVPRPAGCPDRTGPLSGSRLEPAVAGADRRHRRRLLFRPRGQPEHQQPTGHRPRRNTSPPHARRRTAWRWWPRIQAQPVGLVERPQDRLAAVQPIPDVRHRRLHRIATAAGCGLIDGVGNTGLVIARHARRYERPPRQGREQQHKGSTVPSQMSMSRTRGAAHPAGGPIRSAVPACAARSMFRP